MKRQRLSGPTVATHHGHWHFMCTQQTQMDRAAVDNVNERACFRVCVRVFVYTSTHVNMGPQLSVHDAGNGCWSPNIEIRHNILTLFSLRVVTVDESNVAASALICDAVG